MGGRPFAHFWGVGLRQEGGRLRWGRLRLRRRCQIEAAAQMEGPGGLTLTNPPPSEGASFMRSRRASQII